MSFANRRPQTQTIWFKMISADALYFLSLVTVSSRNPACRVDYFLFLTLTVHVMPFRSIRYRPGPARCYLAQTRSLKGVVALHIIKAYSHGHLNNTFNLTKTIFQLLQK